MEEGRPATRRVNGLSEPYSSQSQLAVGLVGFCVLGVLLASRLPPVPSHRYALWLWAFLPLLWLPLLIWILLMDPGAKETDLEHAEEEERCCYGCKLVPEEGTRHCRRCDKCVVGFDHHCLWLNTCVGSGNYRPWLVFICLMFAWVALGSCISLSSLWRNYLFVSSGRLSVGHRPTVLLLALGSGAVGSWLLLLIVLHSYFAFKNITTVQWIKGAQKVRTRPKVKIPAEQPAAKGGGQAAALILPSERSSIVARRSSLQITRCLAGETPVFQRPRSHSVLSIQGENSLFNAFNSSNWRGRLLGAFDNDDDGMDATPTHFKPNIARTLQEWHARSLLAASAAPAAEDDDGVSSSSSTSTS